MKDHTAKRLFCFKLGLGSSVKDFTVRAKIIWSIIISSCPSSSIPVTMSPYVIVVTEERFYFLTRSSWLNCALRAGVAVYWVSIGQQWLELGGTELI